MKVNVEVDCTPEEARRLMGLPDLTPLHDLYLDKMREAMEGRVNPEMMETLMRTWSPMGEAGLSMWRKLFEIGSKPAA